MRTDEAILHLRASPESRGLIEEMYLDEDARRAAERFARSVEWAEVANTLGPLDGAVAVDLGAGTGTAAYAMAQAGARSVIAIEPNDSTVVGYQCLEQLCAGLDVHSVAAVGESLPLRSESVDIVYARQVLHHTTDLNATIRECFRVLRSGGRFVACREHVVDDQRQLEVFLSQHAVHQLAGGEHAYSLGAYRDAIQRSGLRLRDELGPWDSVINAYPMVKSNGELANAPRILLERRFGWVGALVGAFPVTRGLAWHRLKRRKPGRLYTFVALKP